MAQPFIIASGPAEICSGQQLQLFTNASGNSIRFDGINDYLLGPNDVIPVTGDYTVSVWAKQANPHPGQFSQIIAQGRNFYIGSSNTGTIRVGDSWANTGIPFPTDGQWHFYTVVRTTTNTFLYLDGSLAATKGSAIPPPDGLGNTFPHTLMIGTQWMPIEYFDGYIDDVQIWNAARTCGRGSQPASICRRAYVRSWFRSAPLTSCSHFNVCSSSHGHAFHRTALFGEHR